MKIIFLFFAALNFTFFIWQYQSVGSGGERGPKKLVQDSRVPALVLLEETQAGQKPTKKSATQTAMLDAKSSPAPEPKPTGKTYQACYRIGPFDAVQLLKTTTNTLQEQGADIREHKESKQETLGHWVFLPSFSSWQEARKKVVELEKKGVKDIFILGRGEMKNSVSLGLFKMKESADRRLKYLRGMGLKPRMEIQTTTKELYWLEVNVESEADEQDVKSTLERIAKKNKSLEMETGDCK